METIEKKAAVFPQVSHVADFPAPDDVNDEEAIISDMVEQFVHETILPKIDAIESHDYELIRKTFQEAGELGLMGVEVPEQYGGLDLGKKVSGIIAEKMGYAGSFSVSFNIHSGVGLLPYVYFGNEKQKEKYIPNLVSGKWIGAYALTEPNAGSDALSARTSAKWDDTNKSWILNGEKQWITNAHVAEVFVVFARTDEGMTAFIVERNRPGVSVGPEEKKLGIKGSSTATLILENVSVPQENVLGVVGKGHRIALNILNVARLKLAFSNIGTAKQALEIAIRYGKERKQFQTTIVNFPIIQEKLTNMAISIYGAESMAYYTADLLDQLKENSTNALTEATGDSNLTAGRSGVLDRRDGSESETGQNSVLDRRDRIDSENEHSQANAGRATLLAETNWAEKLSIYAMDCAINKVYSSETLDFTVDEALQIHGGYGYMEDYDIERMYRDSRINRIFEGTNEINRLTIAKAFLNRYYKGEVDLEDTNRAATKRNELYAQSAQHLLQLVLKTLPKMDRKEMDQNQDYLRALADIITDVYLMKAVYLRAEKAAVAQAGKPTNLSMKNMIADTICEEAYQRIEKATIAIIASCIIEEIERKETIDKIKNIPVPLYSDLFLKKRKIAEELIEEGKYS